MKYEITKAYRNKLTVDVLQSIEHRQTIAFGEGLYTELSEEPIKWIATKGFDENNWIAFWGPAKQDHMYIEYNGEHIKNKKLLEELLNCDKEVLKLYV